MFPSGIIVGNTVTKTTASLSIFLRVTTNNTGQKHEFIHALIYNGDMKTDRNSARLPA